MKKISVVLPCYNEEKYIENTIREVAKFSAKNPEYEFIFVNDGSADKTLELLQKNVDKIKSRKIKLISYEKNKGKGHAIKTGVTAADGDYICFTDSDLAYSLNHLEELKKRLNNFDVVIGVRYLAKNNSMGVPFHRKMIGISFNVLSRIILNLKFKDMQAGIKGFRKEAARKLFAKQKIEGWSFDTELLYLANKNNYKVDEMPAELSDNNSYNYSKVKIVRDSAKMFFSLLKIKLNDITGKYD